MSIDPHVQAIVTALKSANLPEIHTLSATAARSLTGSLARRSPDKRSVGSVEDLVIERPDGPAIPARLYQPAAKAAGLLVYFHGGGWVMGDLETSDALLRQLVDQAGVAALSVDYRLAPENPFPAALDDAFAAMSFAAGWAGWQGLPLAIGGDSAGANLATVTALRLRDAGDHSLSFQLLLYPVTDCDLDTGSYRAQADGPILTRAGMEWFWNHYLADAQAREDWRASPLRAADHAGLPPTLIQTAEYDPLRDEGEAYAARLSAAGVPTLLQRRPGLVHGYGALAAAVPAAATALAEAAEALRAALAKAPPQTSINPWHPHVRNT